MEIWKDIVGYEGNYEGSNYGRVRSVERYVNIRYGQLLYKSQIIKPFVVAGGYLQVRLHMHGKGKNFLIHRLVYEAFNGPVPKDMQVNHINEDKTDNRLENLNLMTPKENTNWGTHNQRVIATKLKHLNVSL